MRIRTLALFALFSIVAACDGEDPPMATSIRITPTTLSFSILGDTAQLSAEVLDENGNVMADNFTIQWSSSSPAVASVSGSGLVTSVGGGSTAITAMTSGISGSANVTVDQSGSLRVQSARLATGRLTFPYQDALVGAGGQGAYTWTVASGQLPVGLSLGTDGAITGTPSQEATVSFTAQVQDGAGATASKSLSVTVCPAPVQIALGQIVEGQAGPGTECGFFLPAGSAGDAYRVALVRLNSSTTAGLLPDTLEMKAFGLVTGPAASPLSAAMEPGSFPQNRLNVTPQMMEALRVEERTSELHMRIREGEQRLIASLDRSALMPPRPASESGGGAASAAFRVDPPSTVNLTFPNIAATSCTGGSADPATLRGFNDQLAIYESDANSPAVGQAEVDQILNYYRDYGDQVIQSYFGGVTDIDGDGRIVVLITPNVGDGTAAFVWSGDYFATTECADSNVGEYVYFNPTTISAIADGNFQALNTMVHEAKHVSSLYNRIASPIPNSPFHPGFIEEGTAEIAGEIAGRLSWAANGGPAVGAKVTDQDWQGQNAVTANSYGIFLRLARMVFYMSSQPNGVSASYSSRQGGIYGSGVMFHRWLADAYTNATTPFGDSDLFKTQNDSLTSGGVGAYPTLVGKSYLELLEEYGKVVMMHGTGFEAPRTFTTYDLSTTTEVFSLPDPAGTFPWPVTLTCGGVACPDDVDSRDPESLPDNDDRNVQAWMPFSTRTFDSPMGAGGIRVFEFQSGGTGDGVEITAIGTSQTKVYVTKIR